MSEIIWTMDSDYCDNCGIYLYDGGLCDDNCGLCGTCFDLYIAETNEDDDEWEYWPDEYPWSQHE